jgi:hypothetical protein
MTTQVLMCPDCGGEVMEAVSDGEMTNFRCVGCGGCWRVELGWVSRIVPSTCPGCEHHMEDVAATE